MKILLIKTSSLGDLIHTFPAITDLHNTGLIERLDWVVERSFEEVPTWHPAVDDVIPVDMRRWVRRPLARQTWREWQDFVRRLQRYDYDAVLDAQGLIKSALIARKSLGPRYGLDWHSAWESLASLVYHKRSRVDPHQHAIARMRALFEDAFDYARVPDSLDFGLHVGDLAQTVDLPLQPYLVFAHATTWESKKWPASYWRELIRLAGGQGFLVLLPWGNPAEQTASQQLAQGFAHAQVLDKLSLTQCAQVLANAHGMVSVDTGLGHIGAALGVAQVSLYGPTDPAQTGTLGPNAISLQSQFACAPCVKSDCHYRGAALVQPACFLELTPQRVWQTLLDQMKDCAADEIIDHHHDLQPA